MRFEVLKPFTWAGQELVRGDTVEIPDESPKIGSLARAKFIRIAGTALPGKVELPRVEEVAQEIKAETQPAAERVAVGSSVSRDPKKVVREAKARAGAKR